MNLIKRFTKRKPRIFLGSIQVTDKSKDFSWLQKNLDSNYQNIESRLVQFLKNVITLPNVLSITDPRPNDLAIDLLVPDFDTGDAGGTLNFGDLGIPLFSRPKSTVKCRIYRIDTLEVINEVSKTETMGFFRYLSCTLSLKSFLGFSGINARDFEYLVGKATLKCLEQINRKI